MSDRSQKVMRNLAAAVLVIVFVVFAVLFFTGQVGNFMGIESGTSSDTASASVPGSSTSNVQDAAASTATSSAASGTPSAQSVQSSVITSAKSTASEAASAPTVQIKEYKFRNRSLLEQHYEKHGKDMGFKSAEEYEKAAAAVPNDPAALHKTEKEDGDDVYYIESTNEFVVISTDGYIRTYFNPDRGIDYYNKQ